MPGETRRALRVEEVSTAAELEALRAEWGDLWARSPDATPFQSPEWLLPWWRWFGGEGLWTLALRWSGTLVGLAPLFVWKDPESGMRQVTLLGNGVTDHGDVLLDPAVGAAGADAVLGHLAAHAGRWDVCDFRDLPAGSPLVRARLPGGLAARVEEEEPCLALDLPDSLEKLRDSVPPKLLGNLLYARRRAARTDAFEVECATPDTADAHFGILLRLHRARWDARGGRGVLDGPGVEAFHREVAAGFAARGWLRLYILRLGGREIAAHYGFCAKGRAFYYVGGFDPEWKKLSPGTLAVGHAVEAAVREGAREFDFLRGRESYKYAWGAVDRPKRRWKAGKQGAAMWEG